MFYAWIGSNFIGIIYAVVNTENYIPTSLRSSLQCYNQ